MLVAAVAWPSKNPGFAALVAVGRGMEDQTDSYIPEICLLAEFESGDIRELIQECGRLDKRWEPDRWVGDTTNGAAEEFISEYNENAERQFELMPTYLLDIDGRGNRMNPMLPYVLGTIKRLLDETDRLLFLKGGKVANRLSAIDPREMAELEGNLPPIEALGYAIVEVLGDVKPAMTQTRTADGPIIRSHGEFDYLLKSGATDPGVEFDPDYEDEDDGEYSRTI